MDPFTQRMLERARARQEKIDQKLASSGQSVPKRKPLAENLLKTNSSPVKSPSKPARESITSPKRSVKESVNCNTPVIKRVIEKSERKAPSAQKVKNDVIVTKKEFKSPNRSSLTRRNSDVSVEINISHRNDIQIEVQVEERDAPISIVYDSSLERNSNVEIKEILGASPKKLMTKPDMADNKIDKSNVRTNFKSRLDRLGNLYSDTPTLSSPIHRTELEFSAATPPSEHIRTERANEPKQDGKKKFGRLAALADEINNWEDDLSHHSFQPEVKKAPQMRTNEKDDKLDASTLDVSIHSINDINNVLKNTKATFKKPTEPQNNCQRLDKQIVAELEPSAASTTPSAHPAPVMATAVAAPPAVTKKPSIKKYKAPTPPPRDECDDRDKENVVDETVDSCQTKETPASPAVKRLLPRQNVDRSTVLSKAAMFESGSPKAKDPAEMTLRERKALFEKNKGTIIVPKAPFGLAPSIKTLHADKAKATPKTHQKPKSAESSRTNSKDSLAEDNISQSSVGGGIKGKLAALFNKEQTISETTIANKFKQEREKEMEMLQNRFHFKPPGPQKPDDSDDDESDPSEKAPLMGSTISLSQRKPEIINNVPKPELEDIKDDVIVQPVKRRSSQQDSSVVLSVLEDVKRIKVNSKENGTVVQQPTSLYPRLSDIDADAQEENSDCGGSRCGYYTVECIFFFLCI